MPPSFAARDASTASQLKSWQCSLDRLGDCVVHELDETPSAASWVGGLWMEGLSGFYPVLGQGVCMSPDHLNGTFTWSMAHNLPISYRSISGHSVGWDDFYFLYIGPETLFYGNVYSLDNALSTSLYIRSKL